MRKNQDTVETKTIRVDQSAVARIRAAATLSADDVHPYATQGYVQGPEKRLEQLRAQKVSEVLLGLRNGADAGDIELQIEVTRFWQFDDDEGKSFYSTHVALLSALPEVSA